MILNRILLGAGLSFMLMGATCVTTAQQDVAIACAVESSAHSVYVSFVAPNRPAAAVAKEARIYAVVQTLCQQGGTLDQINMAIANAQAARQ